MTLRGRPPAADVARTEQIVVRATPDEREAWLAAASEQQLSLAEWVRRALATAVSPTADGVRRLLCEAQERTERGR